jgi:hypothetical protein
MSVSTILYQNAVARTSVRERGSDPAKSDLRMDQPHLQLSENARRPMIDRSNRHSQHFEPRRIHRPSALLQYNRDLQIPWRTAVLCRNRYIRPHYKSPLQPEYVDSPMITAVQSDHAIEPTWGRVSLPFTGSLQFGFVLGWLC